MPPKKKSKAANLQQEASFVQSSQSTEIDGALSQLPFMGDNPEQAGNSALVANPAAAVSTSGASRENPPKHAAQGSGRSKRQAVRRAAPSGSTTIASTSNENQEDVPLTPPSQGLGLAALSDDVAYQNDLTLARRIASTEGEVSSLRSRINTVNSNVNRTVNDYRDTVVALAKGQPMAENPDFRNLYRTVDDQGAHLGQLREGQMQADEEIDDLKRKVEQLSVIAEAHQQSVSASLPPIQPIHERLRSSVGGSNDLPAQNPRSSAVSGPAVASPSASRPYRATALLSDDDIDIHLDHTPPPIDTEAAPPPKRPRVPLLKTAPTPPPGDARVFVGPVGPSIYDHPADRMRGLIGQLDNARSFSCRYIGRSNGKGTVVLVTFDDRKIATAFVNSWMRQRPSDAPSNCIAVHSNDRDLANKWHLLRAPASASWKELFAGQSQATGTFDGTLSIACWNIAGNFALKCRLPEVQHWITKFDLLFVLETWLVPGQEESLPLPPGYTAVAASRPLTADCRNGRGGIVVIKSSKYNEMTPVTLNLPYNHDILCLDCQTFVILAAYLTPSGCPWQGRQDIDPESIYATAVYETLGMGKPALLLGDLNARTANIQTSNDPFYHMMANRTSSDSKTCPRGNRLISLFRRKQLLIINGTKWDLHSPGLFTCHRENGDSVVDYVITSASLTDAVLGMSVEQAPCEDAHSDHAMVVVRLMGSPSQVPNLSSNGGVQFSAAGVRKQRESRRGANCPVELDRLVRNTVAKAMSNSAATNALYGPLDAPRARKNVQQVYIGTVRSLTTCAVGLFFGHGAAFNLSKRGPEGVDDDVLIAYGVREALQLVEQRREVVIYTTSSSVTRAIAYDASCLKEKGWIGKGGAVLLQVAMLIRRRAANLELRVLEGVNGHLEEAIKLARHAVDDPLAPALPLVATAAVRVPANFWGSDAVPMSLAKAVTPLPEQEKSSLTSRPRVCVAEEEVPDDEDVSDVTHAITHRGRAKMRRAQADNLQLVINAGSNAAFWKIIKTLLDPVRRPSLVSALQLHRSFSARLNPPLNRVYHPVVQDAQEFTANLPCTTIETACNPYFTSPVTIDEIQWVKQKLRKRSSNAQGSAGLDGVTTKVLMRIPDEDFVTVIGRCISRLELPSDWLCTTLVGILKLGKPATDPEGYRLIGLESCFLKFMMMIFDQRLRKWAESRSLLPASQNGFRPGYRTHNNSFILRTAIDCARAERHSLFVVFVDLKNAFPSTVLAVLWKKLYQWGARGPWMDWVRKLYREMEYVVLHEGICGEFFSSMIGLLTGDNSSPSMWNVYFSDLHLPALPNDVLLDGVPVSHLEQADDLVLFSYSPAELQAKLDCFVEWCLQNGMEISVGKTKWMYFSARPPQALTPTFEVRGQGIIDEVHEYKYVGITFANSPRKDLFHLHYDKCASKARSASAAALSLQQLLGSIPPHEGRQLYHGRIDPFLTLGAEVVIDVTQSELAKIELVQKWILRRMLGVNSSTALHVLYTELNIMPIKYRRLHLAFRYLAHIVGLPEDMMSSVALRTCIRMNMVGEDNWLAQLTAASRAIGISVRDWNPAMLADGGRSTEVKGEAVLHAADMVLNAGRQYVMEAMQACGRITLRRDRRILVGKGVQLYLRISNARHRHAMLQLLTANHELGIEMGRRVNVERAKRLCRMCLGAVEDELHVLFECSASPRLVLARQELFQHVEQRVIAELVSPDRRRLTRAFETLIKKEDCLPSLGFLAHTALDVFYAVPVYLEK